MNILHWSRIFFFLFFNTILTMAQLILLLTVNPNVVLLFVLLMRSCLNELILECAQFLYLSRNPFMSLWKYCFETSPHRDGISRSRWRLAFFFLFSTQTNLGNYHLRHKDDSSGNVRKHVEESNSLLQIVWWGAKYQLHQLVSGWTDLWKCLHNPLLAANLLSVISLT